MPRRRKDGDPLGLAGTRLVVRRGRIYYRHRPTDEAPERWEDFGTDLKVAKDRARLFNEPGSIYGTVEYWLDLFLLDCRARVAAKTLAQRTLDDYTDDVEYLKPYFGSLLIQHVRPTHVTGYLEMNAEAGRATRGNREKACLSAMISWVLRRNDCPPDLQVNPCFRQSGVTRNPESKRDRYVTDEEYLAVYEAGSKSVKVLMELTFRTLQRPESDIIGWTTSIVRNKGADKILHFRQGKTARGGRAGRLMEIGLEGRLLELLESIIGTDDRVSRIHQPLVATLDGHHYTYDGISAMLKKAIAKVRAAHRKTGGPLADMPSFGFRDIKGKGATDMWLSGTPIEEIQALCGHADKATTEIYVKARYRETIRPNLIAF